MANLKEAATSSTNILVGFAVAVLIGAVVVMVLGFGVNSANSDVVVNATKALVGTMTSVFGNIGSVLVLIVLLLAVFPLIQAYFRPGGGGAAAV